MPPELKKVIDSIEGMTCENCVYSTCRHPDAEIPPYSCHMIINKPNGLFDEVDQNHFCSEGQWLWLGVWSSVTDDRPQTHLFHFEELYEMFARSNNATRT